MRIDNTESIVDNITLKNSKAETATEDVFVNKLSVISEKPYSVKQTTVEKAIYSLESELEKIQQQYADVDVKFIKDQMAILSNTMSSNDLGQMQEQGYSINDTEIETIVTVMDKIKLELAKGGVDISVFGDSLDMDQLKQMTGDVGIAESISSALEEADLAVNGKNQTDMEEALKQAESLRPLTDGEIKYLMINEMTPTIANLYKAQHSGSLPQVRYYSILADDEKLNMQMKYIIQTAGMPVNKSTMDYGKFMVGNAIPLTSENLKYMDKLHKMQFPLPEDEVIQAMTVAIAEGGRPEDAMLQSGYSLIDRATLANEVIQNASDKDVAYIVNHDMPLTVNSLQQAANMEGVPDEEEPTLNKEQISAPSPEALPEEDIRFITARRQLEETRLVMTKEAGYVLLKMGVSIETEDLEKLVDELKAVEDKYYQTLLSQKGVDPTKENTELFAESLKKTAQLKELPAYALGKNIKNATINQLHQAGQKIKAVMDKAGDAYEKMMTAPRRDLGDNIQKAFQNVDHILEDLELDTIPENQRAVRILGYNGLEVNNESIAQMKAADQKVQLLVRNMTPPVVLEMIREGINPLETDIDTLNAKAHEINERLDMGQDEKFSKYLWKLEQKNEITPEEKESYLGIYRLLNQIEKTDGAVIGAVMNQGMDISLKNLLGGVRSEKAKGIDIKVNDSFGALENVEQKDISISQQIEAAYQTDCAKEAFSMLTQEGVEQAMHSGGIERLSPEQFLRKLKNEQVTLENERAYQNEQLQEFSRAQKGEETVLRMLTNYEIPTTVHNIMAAGRFLNNRNRTFQQIFDSSNLAEEPDLKEAKQTVLEKFAEAVKTPEDMAKAQLALAETAENVMETMINEKEISSIAVRDLKIMRQEISLSTKMSKEENYAVPVLVGDELTNVQLKIVRGKKEKGKIDIFFETEKFGKVMAKIQVDETKINGYVATDSKETAALLKKQNDLLEEMLGKELELPVHMDYVQGSTINASDIFTARAEKQDSETAAYEVQTRQLYGISKSFLNAIKGIKP